MNAGKKPIRTDEYCHNFMAVQNDPIGGNYQLVFPFTLKPELFEETVNPESVVRLDGQEITFNGPPGAPFFFSQLTARQSVRAAWELFHLKTKIGIRESTDFETNKINLWGWKHVISPELFHQIHLAPTETTQWTRNYEFFEF